MFTQFFARDYPTFTLITVFAYNILSHFQMANKIDMNMQSDLMAAFEGSL